MTVRAVFRSLQQDRGRHTQRGGQETKLDIGHLAFAAFDSLHGIAADGPAHDGCPAGEIFLREILLFAQALDCLSD